MANNFNTNTENKDEWLTPPALIYSLGQFDLDPSSPHPDRRPWPTAKEHYWQEIDGLSKDWFGRVWCNPPYGKETFKWIEKLAKHGNGTALIFARTETIGFHKHIWDKADAVFFFKGRIKFYHVNGVEGSSANAPSCLVLFGEENIQAVKKAKLKGKLVILRGEEK